MELTVEHKHELHGRVISRKHLHEEHLEESDRLWKQVLWNHEVLIELLGQ